MNEKLFFHYTNERGENVKRNKKKKKGLPAQEIFTRVLRLSRPGIRGNNAHVPCSSAVHGAGDLHLS